MTCFRRNSTHSYQCCATKAKTKGFKILNFFRAPCLDTPVMFAVAALPAVLFFAEVGALSGRLSEPHVDQNQEQLLPCQSSPSPSALLYLNLHRSTHSASLHAVHEFQVKNMWVSKACAQCRAHHQCQIPCCLNGMFLWGKYTHTATATLQSTWTNHGQPHQNPRHYNTCHDMRNTLSYQKHVEHSPPRGSARSSSTLHAMTWCTCLSHSWRTLKV